MKMKKDKEKAKEDQVEGERGAVEANDQVEAGGIASRRMTK